MIFVCGSRRGWSLPPGPSRLGNDRPCLMQRNCRGTCTLWNVQRYAHFCFVPICYCGPIVEVVKCSSCLNAAELGSYVAKRQQWNSLREAASAQQKSQLQASVHAATQHMIIAHKETSCEEEGIVVAQAIENRAVGVVGDPMEGGEGEPLTKTIEASEIEIV